MEGGAHVVIEAIRSGTPVLASRIDGNLGLLGSDYDGCLRAGRRRALAPCWHACRDDPDMLPGPAGNWRRARRCSPGGRAPAATSSVADAAAPPGDDPMNAPEPLDPPNPA
jgi:hypothetical protein